MKKRNLILATGLALALSACSAGSNYSNEFGQIGAVGTSDTSQLSNADMHAAIERAYLEGELTSEQARKAHTQLDVKGHLTAEQIAVINRDRLNQRHKYESSKEKLDVYRDVTKTGSSMVNNIKSMRDTLKVFFK